MLGLLGTVLQGHLGQSSHYVGIFNHLGYLLRGHCAGETWQVGHLEAVLAHVLVVLILHNLSVGSWIRDNASFGLSGDVSHNLLHFVPQIFSLERILRNSRGGASPESIENSLVDLDLVHELALLVVGLSTLDSSGLLGQGIASNTSLSACDGLRLARLLTGAIISSEVLHLNIKLLVVELSAVNLHLNLHRLLGLFSLQTWTGLLGFSRAGARGFYLLHGVVLEGRGLLLNKNRWLHYGLGLWQHLGLLLQEGWELLRAKIVEFLRIDHPAVSSDETGVVGIDLPLSHLVLKRLRTHGGTQLVELNGPFVDLQEATLVPSHTAVSQVLGCFGRLLLLLLLLKHGLLHNRGLELVELVDLLLSDSALA